MCLKQTHFEYFMTNVTTENYKEKQTLIRLLFVITGLLLFDIGADIFVELYEEVFHNISTLLDVTVEVVTLSCVLRAAYIASRMLKREHDSNTKLKQNLIESKQDALHLQAKVNDYILDFQQQLLIQLDEWNLSKSEKEIAILLLKGKSSKDIATIRRTSERTIRNQCQAIYAKSGLAGRNEIAPFFFTELLKNIKLEDLSEANSHIYAKNDHQNTAHLGELV